MVLGQTSTNPLLAAKKTPTPEKTPEEKCAEQGGKWNGSRCIMPAKKTEEKPKNTQQEKYQAPEQAGNKFFLRGKEVTKEQYNRVSGSIGKTGTDAPLTNEDKQIIQDIKTDPAQLSIEQERQRLIAEETPQQVELNPKEKLGEAIPIWGSFQKAGTGLGVKIKEALGLQPNSVMTEEEMIQAGLSDIQRQELAKGLTWSETVGSVVEGMPFGAKVSQYGDIETPRGNLEEVFKDIKSMRKRVSNIETNVKMGYLPTSVAQEQIKDIEKYVDLKEARLQLLISRSPSLNFNSDRVNSFETDILIVREKLFQAKLNVLTGKELDPTAVDILAYNNQDTDWNTEDW